VVLSGLQDQLAPLQRWLSPRRVYLQIEDQALTAMVLAGERVVWQERLPLPAGLCEAGHPTAVEALGDFLGDLLVERGFPGARIKAVLPRAATAWRVVEWPDGIWPDDPERMVHQQQDQLHLPWSLQDADLWLEPLIAAQPRSLLVTVQRSVLEAWIEVCHLAGVALDGVEALPICLWRAVAPQLQLAEGVRVVLQLEPDQSWLLALDQGQPLGEWPMPQASHPEDLSLALAGWARHYAPGAAVVIGGEPACAEALGCPVSGFQRLAGEPALWGLVEGEQRR
jgi:hypothetical protein